MGDRRVQDQAIAFLECDCSRIAAAQRTQLHFQGRCVRKLSCYRSDSLDGHEDHDTAPAHRIRGRPGNSAALAVLQDPSWFARTAVVFATYQREATRGTAVRD